MPLDLLPGGQGGDRPSALNTEPSADVAVLQRLLHQRLRQLLRLGDTPESHLRQHSAPEGVSGAGCVRAVGPPPRDSEALPPELSSGTLPAQGQHHQRQSVPLHKGGQLRLAPQHIGLLL